MGFFSKFHHFDLDDLFGDPSGFGVFHRFCEFLHSGGDHIIGRFSGLLERFQELFGLKGLGGVRRGRSFAGILSDSQDDTLRGGGLFRFFLLLGSLNSRSSGRLFRFLFSSCGGLYLFCFLLRNNCGFFCFLFRNGRVFSCLFSGGLLLYLCCLGFSFTLFCRGGSGVFFGNACILHQFGHSLIADPVGFEGGIGKMDPEGNRDQQHGGA